MFNTLPYNSFPASTAKFEEGKNDTIQAEIDAIKDGTNIDSFGDVETALATKTNLSNIAPTFDSESGTYDIGEQVIYEGVLYEFISAHDTPGDWDSTEVHAVKISELIDTLNSKLITGQPVYKGGFYFFKLGNVVLISKSNGSVDTDEEGNIQYDGEDLTVPVGFLPVTSINLLEAYASKRISIDRTTGKICMPNDVSATGVIVRLTGVYIVA